MFCPQCGTQAEQQTKFCKSCGVKLADHAQLLAVAREAEPGRMSREEAGRQLRWLKGTKALVTSGVLMPFIAFFVALTAIAHGPDMDMFGVISLALISIWMGASGWGLVHLLRGGFFKTYKERRIRAEAALLNPQPLASSRPQDSFSAPPETNRISSFSSGGVGNSITEPTTRELRSLPGDSGKIA